MGCLYFSITSDDRVVGFLTDDAIYLLMAEVYSPWHAGTDSLLEFVRSQNHFPPFYPVIMGLLGVDSGNPVLASHISVCMLITGLIGVGFWVYRESGSFITGLGIPVLIAILPGTLIFTQGLWSEFLFICLLYAALFILSKSEITGQHWLIAALLIALCALTRIVGVTLIAAYCLMLLIRRPRFYPYYAAVSVIPIVLWLFIGSGRVSETTYVGTLLDSLSNLNPTRIIDIITNKVSVIYYSMSWLLSGYDKSGQHPLLIGTFLLAMLAIAIPAIIKRFKQRKIDVYFLILYMLVILVWPYSDTYFVSRFLFPVLPVFFLYIYLGLTILTHHKTYRIYGFCILLILGCTVGLPMSWHIIHMATTSVGRDLDPYRRHRSWLASESHEDAVKNARQTKIILTSLQELRKYIPEDECVYSAYTGLVMLHTRRISGALPEPATTDAAFDRQTKKCRYIIALPLVDQEKTYPAFYPVKRLEHNKHYRTTPFLSKLTNFTKPALYLIERVKQTGKNPL